MLSIHDKCLLGACLGWLNLLLLSPSNRLNAQAWKIALIVPPHELQAACSPDVPGGLKNKPQEAHDGVERDIGQARTVDGDEALESGHQGKLFQCWRCKTRTRLPLRVILKWAFTFTLPLPSYETLANQSSSCAIHLSLNRLRHSNSQSPRHTSVNTTHPSPQSPADI